MRRTEGTFAAELSMLRVPWTAGRTISFSGSVPCRTIRDRRGSSDGCIDLPQRGEDLRCARHM